MYWNNTFLKRLRTKLPSLEFWWLLFCESSKDIGAISEAFNDYSTLKKIGDFKVKKRQVYRFYPNEIQLVSACLV